MTFYKDAYRNYFLEIQIDDNGGIFFPLLSTNGNKIEFLNDYYIYDCEGGIHHKKEYRNGNYVVSTIERSVTVDYGKFYSASYLPTEAEHGNNYNIDAILNYFAVFALFFNDEFNKIIGAIILKEVDKDNSILDLDEQLLLYITNNLTNLYNDYYSSIENHARNAMSDEFDSLDSIAKYGLLINDKELKEDLDLLNKRVAFYNSYINLQKSNGRKDNVESLLDFYFKYEPKLERYANEVALKYEVVKRDPGRVLRSFKDGLPRYVVDRNVHFKLNETQLSILRILQDKKIRGVLSKEDIAEYKNFETLIRDSLTEEIRKINSGDGYLKSFGYTDDDLYRIVIYRKIQTDMIDTRKFIDISEIRKIQLELDSLLKKQKSNISAYDKFTYEQHLYEAMNHLCQKNKDGISVLDSHKITMIDVISKMTKVLRDKEGKEIVNPNMDSVSIENIETLITTDLVALRNIVLKAESYSDLIYSFLNQTTDPQDIINEARRLFPENSVFFNENHEFVLLDKDSKSYFDINEILRVRAKLIKKLGDNNNVHMGISDNLRQIKFIDEKILGNIIDKDKSIDAKSEKDIDSFSALSDITSKETLNKLNKLRELETTINLNHSKIGAITYEKNDLEEELSNKRFIFGKRGRETKIQNLEKEIEDLIETNNRFQEEISKIKEELFKCLQETSIVLYYSLEAQTKEK